MEQTIIRMLGERDFEIARLGAFIEQLQSKLKEYETASTAAKPETKEKK